MTKELAPLTGVLARVAYDVHAFLEGRNCRGAEARRVLVEVGALVEREDAAARPPRTRGAKGK